MGGLEEWMVHLEDHISGCKWVGWAPQFISHGVWSFGRAEKGHISHG